MKSGSIVLLVCLGMKPIEILLSPMALAALGATVGYNAKVGFTVSAPIFTVSF